MSHRIVQLNLILRKDIAHYISRNIHIRNAILSVSFVALKPDCSSADVGIVCAPMDNITLKNGLSLLHKHAYTLQKLIASRYNFTKIPILHFMHDETTDSVQRIDELIEQTKHD